MFNKFNSSKKFNTVKSLIKVGVCATVFLILFTSICSFIAPSMMHISVTKAYVIGFIIATLTFIATIYIYKPLTSLLPTYQEKSQKDYEEEIRKLQTENSILNNQINTIEQVQQLTQIYTSERNLQIMKISKTGFIVKEERLTSLTNDEHFHEIIPQSNWLQRMFQNPREWFVFYCNNKTYQYSIGIRLDNIQYAIDYKARIIYFKNVELSRLDHIDEDYGEYDVTHNDANHVWIMSKDNNDNYTIINNEQHREFKDRYEEYQENVTGNAIQDSIDKLCEYYTEGLQRILCQRYSNRIRFVDKEEIIRGVEWKTLSEGQRTNIDIALFMNELYLTFDTMILGAENNVDFNNSMLTEQSDTPTGLITS